MSVTLNQEDSFFVTESMVVNSSSSSKGNQDKWKHNNIWLKSDDLGYEGLAEKVCSQILLQSNISNYVDYNTCKIIEESNPQHTLLGCCSDNFLGDMEDLITISRLFESRGIDLDLRLEGKNTVDKLKYVIEGVEKYTELVDFKHWLGLLLEFDALVLNEDRHFHNIGVIFNSDTDTYSLMPIFDNGAGLLSDTHKDYPMGYSVDLLMRSVKSKPIATSFSKQLKAVYQVCGQNLKLKNIPIISDSLYSSEIVSRVNSILGIQKNKYKYLFDDGGCI